MFEPSFSELQALLDAAAEFGVKDGNDLAVFLSLVFYQTGFLSIFVENLNYSTPQRLVEKFSPQISRETAESYVHKPVELANLIYNGRMGNTEPGDGFKYRGSGYIHIFGRDSYREISERLGLGAQLETDPGQLVQDRKLAARAAAFIFTRETARLRATGTPIQFVATWKKVSGGLTGMSEGKAIYDRIILGAT
jgi:putative chitinase